jgi:hypothetical protein
MESVASWIVGEAESVERVLQFLRDSCGSGRSPPMTRSGCSGYPSLTRAAGLWLREVRPASARKTTNASLAAPLVGEEEKIMSMNERFEREYKKDFEDYGSLLQFVLRPGLHRGDWWANRVVEAFGRISVDEADSLDYEIFDVAIRGCVGLTVTGRFVTFNDQTLSFMRDLVGRGLAEREPGLTVTPRYTEITGKPHPFMREILAIVSPRTGNGLRVVKVE